MRQIAAPGPPRSMTQRTARPIASTWCIALAVVSVFANARSANSQSVAAAPAPASVDAAALKAIVGGGQHPAMRWPQLVDVTADLRSAYDGAAWTPLWSRGGRATAAATAMLDQLAAADARGLRPEDYDASTLRRLASDGALGTPAARAAFDVALSADAARFVRALRFGRVSARAAHAELRFTPEPLDVAATVSALAQNSRPAATLDALEPPYEHYRLLKAALTRYRALARDTSLRGVNVSATLKPSGRDPGVPRLRRLLRALGDLPSEAAVVQSSVADSAAYEPALVEAVRHFQRREGLDADGVLGPGTRTRLDRPFQERTDQIALTLERWRWLPHVFTEPPVIVNVPAFRLHAFSSGSDREADLLSMDVAVGDAFDHRTPVFSDSLRYLIFSPYWDVPPSIARAEILPKARRDASYLSRGNYEIVDSRERVLPASGSALAAVSAGNARIRQKPGPTNSLGRVKFIFPNAHNVYLHDTPAQAAFERARRDVSHGCIRLAEPARLAQFLLRTRPGWDSTRVASAMSQERPEQVNLPRPVPVHIVYATAVAREDGRVFFYDDIYGHDRALARLLAGGYPFSR